MSSPVQAVVAKQVSRVSRRLFVQSLLSYLAIGWSLALIAGIGWMLVQPYALTNPPDWLRWAVLGGCVGVATLVAVVLTILRRPTKALAALSLDSEFGLRERVITACTLTPDLAATSAGQALLADTHAKVAKLNVAEKFPVRLPRASAWLPVTVAAVALVALFYNPTFQQAQGNPETKPLDKDVKKALDKKLEEVVKKKPRTPQQPEDRPKSADLQRLEAKLDEIAKQPRDNTQQLRERIKDLTSLEEEIKKLERERSEKARAMQQQLQSKDKFTPNDVPKDGPAKDLTQALADGDLEKAKDELDKLAKKIEKNELSDKEKEQLQKQLENLEKKLQDLAQQKQKEDQLKKLAQEGKLDEETLKRELQQLKQEGEKLKDLQKLANKLGQCKQCMSQGDAGEAAKALSQAGQQLGNMELDQKELEDLRDQLARLQDAKDALGRANDGGESEGEPRENQFPQPSDFNKNNGGQGAGRRPDGKQGPTNSFDARQAAQFNPKGKKVFDGYAPGQAFKKKAGVELAGEIQQAAQDAPEAIENQRIPKAARDMARGYFKNLGGQNDAPPAPAKDKQ
ncbi:MAG TPA: hypothetical protein VL371_00325 [Gemmataceae bacterium]|nr:hypothetical protein [Gemmataceae bacterium]